jgi:hypothetical protein
MRSKFVFVIALICMLMTSSIVFANGSHVSNGTKVDYQARVGELANFEGKFDNIDQKQGPFEVLFSAVRLEDGAQILSMKNRSLDGSYKFAMQFFDGAEHEVTVSLINPTTGSVITEKKIKVEVQAFHPPMFIKIKTLAFLIIIIAIGMVAGVKATRFGKVNRKLEGGHPNVT